MSLRTRLLVGLAVLVLAAIASTGWLVLQVARVQLASAQEAHARALGTQLVAMLAHAVDSQRPLDDPQSRQALARTAAALTDGGVVEAVTVVDARGAALVGAVRGDGALAGALGGASFAVRRGPSFFLYAPLPNPAGPPGAVRLAMPGGGELGRALAGAHSLLLAVTLFDGGLVLLFGALYVRRVVGPLEELETAAGRVAAGELDLPELAEPTRGDEIARLIRAFNRMTGSLRSQRDQMVAQEKLATVGRLAAGVAHEVGNPLAAVLGYAEMLLTDEPEGSSRREPLEWIRKETGRIRQIISDLLDYSRPLGGPPEPVRFDEALDAAVALLRPQARFREVKVSSRIPADLPPAAASASRLQQVLVNLLLNAADAMQGRGEVVAEAQVIDDHTLELRLRDSGPGVAQVDRARVFDPFFTTKEPGQGTGLGLAISRAIVEAQAGGLTLLDERPGATFALRLPRWKATPGELE